MYATTIDLGDDTTVIVEQHHLLERLAQLADTGALSSLSDDHVLNQLVERYARYRDEHARISA